MDVPLFSVLIVNFNGRHHLGPCLRSLAVQSLPRHQFEVILVDNASTDGSREFVRDEFPAVRLVALPENTGFTGGNNAGIPLAHGRFLVLLNNDTIPDPHWLAELAEAVREGQAAASKLVFAHDPTVLNSAGLQLLRDGRGTDRGFRHADCGQYEATEPVFAGCGAALAFDMSTIRGPLFDPRYFVYCEDLDTAWRGQLNGHGTQYVPRALVRHVHGGSGGSESPLVRFYSERNRALTNVRNADFVLALLNVIGLAARGLRSAFRWARGRERGPMLRATALAFLSFLRHLPAVLLERFRTRPTCAS